MSRPAAHCTSWRGLRAATCCLQVGGMGDVVTALGRAVQEEGHRVEVILPKFDCINYKEVGKWADARPF